MATYIIPLEKDQWHSKNIEDWIIRSEATYFDFGRNKLNVQRVDGSRVFMIVLATLEKS